MSVRSDVAALITTALPEFRVLPFSKNLDNIRPGQPVVMVTRNSFAPHPESAHVLTHHLDVLVFVGTTDGELAEDDADYAVEDVLTVIEAAENLLWTNAERSTLQEAYAGYKISLAVHTPNYLKD